MYVNRNVCDKYQCHLLIDRCCANFYEDQYGSCRECLLGTYGLNCTGICFPQYYGRLCLSKCYCPLHYCDTKFGCVNYGIDTTWMNVTIALIGSVVTLVVFGLLFLMKSWLAKRCAFWRDGFSSNENQIENTEDVHIYERRRILSSNGEVENVEPHGQSDESNYTDLRRSALFPIYDSPDECKPSQNPNAAPADASKSLALWDLLIDEEDDSSDEEESEIEGHGHLFKHEMYTVLSLRRTYHSMINTSSTETPDGYKSIQLATSKVPGSKVETSDKMSRSLSEMTTIRQSLINETIEEYSPPSNVTKSHNAIEDEDEQQGMVMTGRKSQTYSTRLDRPLQKNIRPYSLAKTSWTSDSKQDKNPIAENINEHDNANEYDVVNKDDVKNDDVKKEEGASEDDDLYKKISA